jgi:c-di-AMP phosphodiesterase-like protein
MSNKPTFKINVPEINIYTGIVGLASVILLFYNVYIGSLFLLGFIYMVFYNFKAINNRNKEWISYIQDLSLDIDDTTKKAILNLPIPLCILEFDGNISWHNTKFQDMVGTNDLIGINIDEVVSNLNLRKVLNETNEMYTDVNYKGKDYTIIYNVLKKEYRNNAKYLMVLYWIDKTEYLQLEKKYKDEQTVTVLIQVDGYDEVVNSASEDKKPLISVQIEKILNELETSTNGGIKRTAKDKFYLVISRKELEILEADKFSILDKIRQIDTGSTIPVTISVGVGIDGETINENLKLATGALDLALGRGGDQVVVKMKDKFAFYGGKSKAIEKKTKVKSRLIGHALREIILESEKIYIMGHKNPDMDAMGAAVGIYDICKSCNKTANIILENSNKGIDEFIKRIKESEYHKNIFIDKATAIDSCTKNTLIIVVDTHRPNFTECEEVLKLSDKVVVIDHHRRGVEFINDTVILFHEIYVSSTCEMVTELIQYIKEDIHINKLTSEGLLAGISLDTKNFAFKTGVRTFEAASYLRKLGADTVEVKKLFNSDIEDFVTKSDIISTTKIIKNRICLAYSKREIDNINVVIAQAADELLNIKDVEASFVLGQKHGKIFISARSLGNINVHVLMEKLGGGGHMDIAGAQLKDVALEEVYKMVSDIIEQYLEEEK